MYRSNLSPEMKYLQENPNASLKEYLDFQKSKQQAEFDEAQELKEKHEQWIIENLVGKNVIFRYESGYRIIKFSLDKYDNIKTDVLYHFGAPDYNTINADYKEYIYRLHHVTSGNMPFRLDWIKSPYDVNKYSCGPKRFPAYVISDEKLNEIAGKLEEYANLFNELTDFENRDWATKIE